MAGVLANGVQWERCNQCGCSVDIRELQYACVPMRLTPRWPEYGHHKPLDLCANCAAP
jgi:hypothetical protein